MSNVNQNQTNISEPNLLNEEANQRRITARRFISESCEIAKTLPPRNKILFLLHYDHGYTNREIAELCQCSENAVNKKMGRISKEINMRRKLLRIKGASDSSDD